MWGSGRAFSSHCNSDHTRFHYPGGGGHMQAPRSWHWLGLKDDCQPGLIGLQWAAGLGAASANSPCEWSRWMKRARPFSFRPSLRPSSTHYIDFRRKGNVRSECNSTEKEREREGWGLGIRFLHFLLIILNATISGSFNLLSSRITSTTHLSKYSPH